MYKDSLLKIVFYKKQILDSLIRNGVYPDSSIISERVKSIDDRLAVFNYMKVAPGQTFDTDKMNQDLYFIYQDLLFLYKLCYELVSKEYENIKSFIDCHIQQMEIVANKYSTRTKLEIDSTTLGKTVLYQASGFDTLNDNDTVVVNLKPVTVSKGSKLACIFDSENAAAKDVLFSFDGKTCSPYSYNKDFFNVPGEIKTSLYNYDLAEDQLVTGAFHLNIQNFKLNAESKYVIFGGKDIISQYDTSGIQRVYKKQNGNSVEIKAAGRIEFYVYGGTFIRFDFSKHPITKNFSETSITNLNKRHKIIIECDSNFVFDFITDGQIYAEKKFGAVKDNKLYYPSSTGLRTFMIEEMLPGETITYNDVKAYVFNAKERIIINAIAIKELNLMEVNDE